jgi:hypothetical protein
MMEILLARLDANHKELLAKIEAETEAIRAGTKAMRDRRMETIGMSGGKRGRPAKTRRRHDWNARSQPQMT